MVSVRERLVGANLFSNQPAREASLNGPSIVKSRLRLQARFNLNSEIETTDSGYVVCQRVILRWKLLL